MIEPLSHEWRLAHAEKGDGALRAAFAGAELADSTSDDSRWLARAAAWAAIAQAHYAAANVRERPKSAAALGDDVPGVREFVHHQPACALRLGGPACDCQRGAQ